MRTLRMDGTHDQMHDLYIGFFAMCRGMSAPSSLGAAM